MQEEARGDLGLTADRVVLCQWEQTILNDVCVIAGIYVSNSILEGRQHLCSCSIADCPTLPPSLFPFPFSSFPQPRDVTGIFALPISQDHSTSSITDGLSFLGPTQISAPGSPPLEGARYVSSIFMGYAGCKEEDSHTDGNSPSKSGRWAAPQSGPKAFLELPSNTTQDNNSTSSTTSQPNRRSAIRTRSLAFVMQTIQEVCSVLFPLNLDRERFADFPFCSACLTSSSSSPFQMKTSSEWNGTCYNLLTHNCNHFSDELVNRLTGSRIPSWINRTAGMGYSLKFLVPTSLIGLDDLDTDATVETGGNEEEKEAAEDGSSLSKAIQAETHSSLLAEKDSSEGKMIKAQEMARKARERKGASNI